MANPAIKDEAPRVDRPRHIRLAPLQRRQIENWIVSALRRNMSLRIISVLLAVGLWIFVNAGQHGSTQSFNVPVVYRGLPPHFLIANPHPESINIQVSGPRTLLSLIDASRLTLKLDLSGVGVGQASFKVGPDSFNVPRQTNVTSIAPSQIVLDIDRIVARDTPVHLISTGKPANGYRIGAEELRPKVVRIRGPSKDVARIDQVDTEPLDLNGVNANLNRTVALVMPAQNVRVDPLEVTAVVTLAPIEIVRQFKGLPIKVHDSDYQFVVEPPKVNVTVRGPMLKLDDLNLDNSATIEADGLEPGSYYVPVTVTLPDGIELVHQSAEKVKLKIVRDKRTARR